MRASRFPIKIELFLHNQNGQRVGRAASNIVVRICAGLVLFFVGMSLLAAMASPDNAPDRIVAVGDVHGDFRALPYSPARGISR